VRNVVGGPRGVPDISMSGACNESVNAAYFVRELAVVAGH
jgi:hypothetical protein